MGHIAGIIIVLGTAFVLPITIVFLSLRKKIESEKNKKEIILAALEKNANINIEELVKKMNVPDKLLKEKLLDKLQWGILMTLIGLGLIIYDIFLGFTGGGANDTMERIAIGGTVCLAIGVAFLFTYANGKKMLVKEMEAEEQNMHHA